MLDDVEIELIRFRGLENMEELGYLSKDGFWNDVIIMNGKKKEVINLKVNKESLEGRKGGR